MIKRMSIVAVVVKMRLGYILFKVSKEEKSAAVFTRVNYRTRKLK